MKKTAINPPNIGQPMGIYSHGIKISGDKSVIFVAGQTAVDSTGRSVGIGDIVAQTKQVMENIKAILHVGGATMDDVVKLNTYHLDVGEEYAKVNAVRAQYFKNHPFPASTRVIVSGLARKEFLIEIEAVAVVSES